jgi:5'-nucleotidase
MDVPAIAISVTDHDVQDFTYAGKVAAQLAKLVAKNGLQRGTLLNVNVPNLPESELKGIKITKQSKAKWDDIYEERIDPYGKSYFWLTGSLVEIEDEEDTDQNMVRQNFVSVTPIHFDLTDYKTYEAIKHWEI